MAQNALHNMSAPLATIPSTNIAALHMSTPDGLTITCHENRIPDFVESELERLYASLYSSLAAFRVYGSLAQASTYVVRKDTEIIAIWLFRREQRQVRVLNEAISLPPDEVRRFAHTIFTLYREVELICFHAVQSEISGPPYPIHRYNCTEDSVLNLPATSEEYLARLGKPTRKNIKRYLQRLKEAFPSFRYRIIPEGQASEQQVRAIIGLNRARMANKGKTSGIDADEERRIIQLVQHCGLVAEATIEGRLCAGAIVYRFGDNYFSFVRAHDPAYNQHRLGLIGAYLLADACIARGGKELHLMWGREPHKALLQGIERHYDHLTLYRSRLHQLRHVDRWLKDLSAGHMRRMKLYLMDKARQEESLAGRMTGSVLRGARYLKRAGQGLLRG